MFNSESIIKKQGNKYILFDHTGRKRLGEFDTKKEAVKREKQIKFFKHRDK